MFKNCLIYHINVRKTKTNHVRIGNRNRSRHTDNITVGVRFFAAHQVIALVLFHIYSRRRLAIFSNRLGNDFLGRRFRRLVSRRRLGFCASRLFFVLFFRVGSFFFLGQHTSILLFESHLLHDVLLEMRRSQIAYWFAARLPTIDELSHQRLHSHHALDQRATPLIQRNRLDTGQTKQKTRLNRIFAFDFRWTN